MQPASLSCSQSASHTYSQPASYATSQPFVQALIKMYSEHLKKHAALPIQYHAEMKNKSCSLYYQKEKIIRKLLKSKRFYKLFTEDFNQIKYNLCKYIQNTLLFFVTHHLSNEFIIVNRNHNPSLNI